MAVFHFYSPENFEPWDFRNPDEVGIGNSETNHIELAWRLAARGHVVHSYSPRREDTPLAWRGVVWHDLKEADLSAPGIWALYRCPRVMDKFEPSPTCRAWLVCQDEDYTHVPNNLTPERCYKVDKFVTLCEGQEQLFRWKYAPVKNRVVRGSNFLRPELVKEVLAESHERDPLRITYASSPDRALEQVLKVFRRAREFVPGLSLHVFYGIDNLRKVEADCEKYAQNPEFGPRARLTLRRVRRTFQMVNSPGVVNHGRVPQPALYREWAKTGILLYPCSHFRETGWVTGMEAQALGAIPVACGPWATHEHTLGGARIAGDSWRDPLTVARHVAEVVTLAKDPGLQSSLRADIMPAALEKFSPESVLDRWEKWAEEPANA